ncbi:MAG: SH3 domain-containing protein [Cyanobacteria bacterium J06592_8]
MDLPIIAFIFGASLLVVGCSGGGVSVKDITVPQVGIVSRVISGLSGMFLITLSILMMSEGSLLKQPLKSYAYDKDDISVNLRQQPSSKSSIIRPVLNNTPITCLNDTSSNSDWVKVRVEDGSREIGYMYRKLTYCDK